MASVPEFARFGAFELDLRTGELRKNTLKIRLQIQPTKILSMLIERPGELVTREEIQRRLWPNDTAVDFEFGINNALARLRAALGDSAREPRFIETLSRRGYRFLAPVVKHTAPVSPQPDMVPAPNDEQLSPPLAPEGTTIGRYRVLERLGSGGMGVVYRAEDTRLGRFLAMKFLPEELAEHPDALDRFRREARAASALNHPNICTIYEIDEIAGQPFIAMELLEGQTVRDRIAEKPFNLKELLDVAIQAVDALDAAHGKGVTHRDIKPANIFIATHGRVKVLDFGLAKLASTGMTVAESRDTPGAEDGGPRTIPGVAMGTVAYMSPEQARGEEVDSRSDLFSFGAVLYEMATGKQAFAGNTQGVVYGAVLHEDPPPLVDLKPALPPKLTEIISKVLEKDRELRYQHASDLRADLKRLQRTTSGSAGAVVSATRATAGVPEGAPSSGPSAVGVPPLPPGRPDPQVLHNEMQRISGTGAGLNPHTSPPSSNFVRTWFPAVAVAIAIGLTAGYFWRSYHTPAPPVWAATRLGGPSAALCPRISPDGQLLAFLTMVNNLLQVAVMKPDGSSWTLLTNQKGAGYASEIAWAADGSKIYFSRFADQPRGVYSIPVLGGETRLLRDNAMGGYPLPDGSLIVAARAGLEEAQLSRFWPDSGREEPLPAFVALSEEPPVTVFPGGKEIAFYGICGTPQNHGRTSGLYVLDLDSKNARSLGGALGPWSNPRSRPMTSSPDGQSLITLAQAEDVYQVVSVPREGGLRPQVLFTLPRSERVLYLSAGTDGSVYIDAVSRPRSLLRFSPDGGKPEENLLGNMGGYNIGEGYVIGSLPGGKFIFPAVGAGRAHLVAGSPGAETLPILETAEESTLPFAASSGGSLAFLLGTPPRQQIGIASAHEGRILKRLSIKASEVSSVALSSDGQTLYYAAGGSVWSLPVDESAPPHRIIGGDQVVVDPSGAFLYVMQQSKNQPVLERVPLAGGAAVPVPIPDGLHVTVNILPANAVDAQGRFVFDSSSADSFFYGAALYDPVRKSVARIPVQFEGSVWSPVWTTDGRIGALGARFASSLWRYHPVSR